MVSIADGRPTRMYLLGGERLVWGDWAVEGAAALHGRVTAHDEAAGTIATDARLPAGQALDGIPFILDLPHNVSFSIDSVESNEDGSTIKLAGLPNLSLTAGMEFSIPVPVFVSERAPEVLLHRAPAGSQIGLPETMATRSLEYEDAGGSLGPLEVTTAEGHCLVSLPPAMLNAGRTHLLIDRPPGATLDDTQPPKVRKVAVNGDSVAPKANLEIPYSAREVVVEFEDEQSDLRADRLQVVLNGRTLATEDGSAVQAVVRGGSARVSVRANDGPPIETLDVMIADGALLRNEATFALRVVRAVEVIELKEANGGKAVRMADAVGYLEARADLSRGDYTADLISMGPSLSTNSMWLEIDGKRVDDPIHLPVEKLGNSSREVEMTGKLTRFSIERDGEHVLRLTLREGPGPVLDKLQIRRGSEVVHQVECEHMLP
jgi:hypothetical protein